MKKTFWNKLTARGTRGKTRCAAAVLALAMTFSMGAPLALAAQPEESTAAVTETVSAQQETAMPTLQTETPELAAQDPEAPPVQATEAEENSTNQHTPENSVVLPVRPAREAACSLDERIANIFLSMGIPAHIKGYHFLREAIKLVVSDREMINAITKDLYPTVAMNFNTTSSKVERAIRHAIDVAWTRGQMENINLLFGSRLYVKHDKPTNGEFIAMIADRLAIEKSA